MKKTKLNFFFNIAFCILPVCIIGFMASFRSKDNKDLNSDKWFPIYDFKATQFRNPTQEYGPFARWWWPGNDVESKELQREINVFADNAFGGVEIQPFNMNLHGVSSEAQERILSWDTPAFYENVRAVMKEARRRNIIVDMNNGSGWPAGGSYLGPEEGFINLLHSSEDIIGGKNISISLPAIDDQMPEYTKYTKLEAVLAVKKKSENGEEETVLLDSNTSIILTDKVKNNILQWVAPEGKWTIIAFWSRPNNLMGSMTASPKQGPVLNHFDSIKVIKNYTHLFGSRTGFEPYYGNPLRAVFNDSYEFAVDRHFSEDFISYFKEKRGYDITPWLPVNMQKKYNYALYRNPNHPPYFSFSEEDWRIRYDYDLTLSELLGKLFIEASSHWLENRGMLHRTQAYGMKMDMMANVGKASIPEAESMLGPEAILKVMSSGAHLYNRPILSAESVVFSKRGYMTTPQKIRLSVDKLFAAGINQIIYHGVPYRYFNDNTTHLGWYPFYMSSITHFSSHLGEGTQFWKYQKEINEYIARTQYALRSGKPHADVLIYLPFMNVEGMPDNPEEILTKGDIADVEPPLLPERRLHEDEKTEWAKKIYPIINELEANGITWDWVNDESIQIANLDKKGQIEIRGNYYQSIVLVDIDIIQLPTAEKLNVLAKKNMNLITVGSLPSKQPSFLNWEKNDKLTKQQMNESISQKNSKHFNQNDKLTEWIKDLKQPVKFKEQYTFIRQIQREMSDGSRIQFIWNKSDSWQPFSLTLDKKYKYVYWMDAETGSITSQKEGNEASYVLPPYSTVILYAGTNNKIDNNIITSRKPTVYNALKVQDINNWDLTVDSITIKGTSLFDWKTNKNLKFSSNEGIYKSTFLLKNTDKKLTYFIDLGKVYFTAEVLINGKPAGKRINAPYYLDITGFLKNGKNTIEIHVIPGQLNGLIGEAEKGNKLYSVFRKQEDKTMSAGLVGPVTLYKKSVE